MIFFSVHKVTSRMKTCNQARSSKFITTKRDMTPTTNDTTATKQQQAEKGFKSSSRSPSTDTSLAELKELVVMCLDLWLCGGPLSGGIIRARNVRSLARGLESRWLGWSDVAERKERKVGRDGSLAGET